ncbi:corticoliberin-like [Emys orbicularis]|uniref:corticoliberin-like n=1 Tax=Emys orbicularis TaxID=82168 RepID=UPI000CE65393|nr:corticoliberin-like [Chrysemys picta bellii]
MRIRMISAASVLVLLFLPSEKGSPLEPEAGPPSLHTPLGPCEAGGAESPPELRRKERSPYSSRRKDGRPNSLDLTFHLLREFLEMSREERLAQKALSNKLLLQNIGK